MTQTEWIVSLDDDLKDFEELFVGNVRDGEQLTRCKDCVHWGADGYKNGCKYMTYIVCENDYCSNAEEKEK
jgi:hypothetical protein